MKRLLSPHEIATLILIASAALAFYTPDVEALAQENLVETVNTASDAPVIQLTSDGYALLRRLRAVE